METEAALAQPGGLVSEEGVRRSRGRRKISVQTEEGAKRRGQEQIKEEEEEEEKQVEEAEEEKVCSQRRLGGQQRAGGGRDHGVGQGGVGVLVGLLVSHGDAGIRDGGSVSRR